MCSLLGTLSPSKLFYGGIGLQRREVICTIVFGGFFDMTSCLAMLGVIVPFCHSILTVFLTPCSPVCALVQIPPTPRCLRAVSGSGCSFPAGSLLKDGSTTGRGNTGASLPCCESPVGCSSSQLAQSWHRWATATVPCPCPYSSLYHHPVSVHGLLPQRVAPSHLLLTPCHFWPIHGVGWSSDWNWGIEHWDRIRIRKVRLKSGAKSVRKAE